MLVIGAGGHALEILDVLQESANLENIYFYDDINLQKNELKQFRVLHSEAEVLMVLSNDFEFVIALGNPSSRKKLFNKFTSMGGKLIGIKSTTAFVSKYSNSIGVDMMKNCFVGPNTTIGIGTLLNTGSQIHHDVCIGEFTEISPRSVLLGNVSVGAYCSIGANSTVLPNIKIGNNVTIGAGAVVTKDLPDNCMAAGVPAIIKNK
jgi:sugar O-acyltransferase (sialic acid O-acetyltransferase NeuD family)